MRTLIEVVCSLVMVSVIFYAACLVHWSIGVYVIAATVMGCALFWKTKSQT